VIRQYNLLLRGGILALALSPLLAGCEEGRKFGMQPPTFDFTRIDAHGKEYKADGDYPSHPWACVRDNRTSLTWEVKTAAGLHAGGNTYTWLNNDAASNGGDKGTADGGDCLDSRCDTQSYIAALNQAQACGYKDWRLPQRYELGSIVDYSIPHPGPTIAAKYFPNTDPNAYWTATPFGPHEGGVWAWRFDHGYDFVEQKHKPLHVLAVRGTPAVAQKK
jgi:hypothetical protein